MNYFHFSLSKNNEEQLMTEIKKKLDYFNKDVLININWMLMGEIIKSGNKLAKDKIKECFGDYGKEYQENLINKLEGENNYKIKKDFQKEVRHPSVSDYIMEIPSKNNSNYFDYSSQNNSINDIENDFEVSDNNLNIKTINNLNISSSDKNNLNNNIFSKSSNSFNEKKKYKSY